MSEKDKKKAEDQIKAPAKEDDKEISDVDPNTIPVEDETPTDTAIM